ncbi:MULTISPECIES: hypothetical protein [Halorussus]|uniref:hypothetical protein n=1 Tax=Halorussus TaxID=1070314 RepID=UPI00209D4681|nr:hypothetical protein [Halorussus vallis]USZ77263.1 hypothetical protein NGM07_08005 [Halorussus vallis]
MRRHVRFAVAAVALVLLAGATPAAGAPPVGTSAEHANADSNGLAVPNASLDQVTTPDTTAESDGDDGDDEGDIVTDGFDPEYDAEAVLDRVEELRGLSATDEITLHEYPDRNGSAGDVRDRFAAIRPAGARALQLYSNGSTDRRTPLGYTVRRGDGVHVYLMNDSDLAAHGVGQEVVLAHELTHALQFQHGLISPTRSQLRGEFSRWTTDARLVATSLVEGDAMWVTRQYHDRYATGNEYSVAEYNRTLSRAAWPHSVGGTPYYYGYRYYERTDAAPDARSAAIRDPPSASAGLLHPGAPTDAGSAAGVPDAPPTDIAGFERYHTDTVGELVVRHALRMNGRSFRTAAEAADGWAADRMYYYRDGPRKATHWVTVWQNESEAAEFAAAWRGTLDSLGATESNGSRAGTTDAAGEPARNVLVVSASESAPAVAYVVEREGATVRVTAARSAEAARKIAAAAD